MATGKAELKSYHEISCPSIDEMVRCKPVSVIIPGKPAGKGQSVDEPTRRMTLIGKIGRWGWRFEPVIVIELNFGRDALDVEQWRRLDEPTEIEAWLFVELMSALSEAQQAAAREATLRTETAAVLKDKNELAAEFAEYRRTYRAQPDGATWQTECAGWLRRINDLIAYGDDTALYDIELRKIVDEMEVLLT